MRPTAHFSFSDDLPDAIDAALFDGTSDLLFGNFSPAKKGSLAALITYLRRDAVQKVQPDLYFLGAPRAAHALDRDVDAGEPALSENHDSSFGSSFSKSPSYKISPSTSNVLPYPFAR